MSVSTSLANTRVRRPNYGNRMAKILDAEEEDVFYKTTYGGFEEVEEDNDYVSEAERSDSIDSDFSIDENDAVISDQEDFKPVRKRGIVTKAYKDPATSKSQPQPKLKSLPPVTLDEPTVKKSPGTRKGTERKNIRASTAQKSEETKLRQKKRAEYAHKRKIKYVGRRNEEMTQEELLAEAKITEEINLKALERHEEMEREKKKKARVEPKKIIGDHIRFQSSKIALPITDISEVEKDRLGIDKENPPPTVEYQRTFLHFTDERTLKASFPQRITRSKQPMICPITRLPARYFDPVTELPYNNIQAFRILREAYYQQLEARGDRSDPQIVEWMEWRKQQHEINKVTAASGATVAPTTIVPATIVPSSTLSSPTTPTLAKLFPLGTPFISAADESPQSSSRPLSVTPPLTPSSNDSSPSSNGVSPGNSPMKQPLRLANQFVRAGMTLNK